MITSLTSLSVAICFVEQYHRPISWGILYFCLKNSIFKGEFTRLLNLPISVNLKINWPNPIDKEWYERVAKENSRGKYIYIYIYMYKENVNSIEINVCNNLWYLNEDFLKISQERRWVGVTCILEKGEGSLCVQYLWNLKNWEKWRNNISFHFI